MTQHTLFSWWSRLRRRPLHAPMSTGRSHGGAVGMAGAAVPMYEAHGPGGDHGWTSLTTQQAPLDVPAIQRQVERLWLTHPLVSHIVQLICDFTLGSGLTANAPHVVQQRAIAECIAAQPDWESLQRGVAAHLVVYGEAILHLDTSPGAGWPRIDLLPPTEVVAMQFDDAGRVESLTHERVIGQRVQRRQLPGSTVVYVRAEAGLPLQRGLPELARIVPWVAQYDRWLEDRVRINRTRGAFAFLRKVPGWGVAPEPSLTHGHAEGVIPRPGAVLVVNDQESWEVLAPEVGADDASADGRALKLMILAGAGIAEHYAGDLAQSNLATAQAAELPMLKRFESHQRRVIGVFRQLFQRLLPDLTGLELTLPSPGLRDAQVLTATLGQQLDLGLISRQTAQSLIPWIADVATERQRLAAERKEPVADDHPYASDPSDPSPA